MVININKKIIFGLIVVSYSISLIFNIYKYEYKYSSDNKNMKYNLMIIEKQKEDDNKISYLVKLNNDKFILNIYTKNKYDAKKDYSKEKVQEVSKYKYGDCINVLGKITIPKMLGNVGEFDYKNYLNSKDICGTINAYEVEYVDKKGNKFIKSMYHLKKKISNSIDNNMRDKEAELLKSMIYGDTRNLDENIEENFNNIGISHITAVSGSNLNILLLMLSFLLYKLKNKRIIYTLVQVILIYIFCVISGMELSIVRASIMSIIGIICKNKNIKLSIDKILLITLYIITILNPFRIFNIGMVFSFLAIIGLVYFSPRIYNFLQSKIKWNIKNKRLSKILCYISKILSVTLSVNILVLPLSIYLFNSFSSMFVISNLLISTLSIIINSLGFVSICIAKIPIISTMIYSILELFLKSIILISNFLNNINISINIKSFPVLIILIYYLYILVICIKLKISKKNINKVLDKIKIKLVYCFLCVILLTFVYNKYLDNYIYFFNVGQGEMSIIKNKDTVIMIDSGSITNDTPYLFESYMKKQNIQKLDALIISHFHSDHINGVLEILKQCEIKYVIYTYPYDSNSEEYINVIKEIEKKDTKTIMVKMGDNLEIGGIKLNILSPNMNNIKVGENVDENENANSLVVNINVNNKNYIFMGDSLKESEQLILNEIVRQNIKNIQLIKIGHHGSKTSTSDKFIKSILPKYAIISAKKNVYKHPSKETINILSKYSVITYITEKVGGIKYII